MIFEMRIYTVRPGTLHDYVNHFETVGLPILSRYAKLVGYWFTDIGELNQLIHIWAYESLDARSKNRAALYEDVTWKNEFLPKALSMLEKQENRIMHAVPFSPIQ